MNVLLKTKKLKSGDTIVYVGLGEFDRFQAVDAFIGKSYDVLRLDVSKSMDDLSVNLHKF